MHRISDAQTAGMRGQAWCAIATRRRVLSEWDKANPPSNRTGQQRFETAEPCADRGGSVASRPPFYTIAPLS